MKSLVMFLNVMNVVSIMSGISALIFSAVTFTNTEVMKKDVNKHHQELSIIPTLTKQNNVTRAELGASLKRLDKDVGKLFDDLGKAYERQQKYKAEFKKAMAVKFNKTKFKILKTYEKINHNTEYIEGVYKNLDERLTSVERRVMYIQKFLEDHTKKNGTY